MDLNFLSRPGQKAAQQYIEPLEHYCREYAINTPKRLSAFLANVAHESAEFLRVTENLNYSPEGLARTWPNRFKYYDGSPNEKALDCARNPEKLANNVYANRMGNGPESSGDGWKYRGRGLIQLTGKENYLKCGKSIGVDLINNPDYLTTPNGAVQSACWFWSTNKLNQFADKSDLVTIRKRINGGTLGLNETMNYYEKLRKVLGD